MEYLRELDTRLATLEQEKVDCFLAMPRKSIWLNRAGITRPELHHRNGFRDWRRLYFAALGRMRRIWSGESDCSGCSAKSMTTNSASERLWEIAWRSRVTGLGSD